MGPLPSAWARRPGQHPSRSGARTGANPDRAPLAPGREPPSPQDTPPRPTQQVAAEATGTAGGTDRSGRPKCGPGPKLSRPGVPCGDPQTKEGLEGRRGVSIGAPTPGSQFSRSPLQNRPAPRGRPHLRGSAPLTPTPGSPRPASGPRRCSGRSP